MYFIVKVEILHILQYWHLFNELNIDDDLISRNFLPFLILYYLLCEIDLDEMSVIDISVV